jgi:hypothetical protein
VWFASVKDQVRQRYDEFRSQKTFTFEVLDEDNLNTNQGLMRFLMAYSRERNHAQFDADLISFLSNLEAYVSFCREHVGRDEFMGLEYEEILPFLHLYQVASTICRHLGLVWDIPTLKELFDEDHNTWKDNYYLLHEHTLTKLISGKLAEKIAKIIPAAQEHVVKTHGQYWSRANKILFTACFNETHKYQIDLLLELTR